MLDKSKELSAKVKLINERLNFDGIVEGNNSISIDYIPPIGDNLGYTSLELFLLSLSSCIGSAMLVFLRRMQKSISAFEISAKGFRNEDHPTGFKSITMNIHVQSPDVTEADLKKVVGFADDKYCPVWSMIKGNVVIEFDYTITKQ
jgi:putative redox protein